MAITDRGVVGLGFLVLGCATRSLVPTSTLFEDRERGRVENVIASMLMVDCEIDSRGDRLFAKASELGGLDTVSGLALRLIARDKHRLILSF